MRNKYNSFLVLLVFICSIGWAQTSADTSACVIKRHALYDVGSGSTKLTVLENDSCKPIPTILLKASEKVDYKDDLLKNKNSEFSLEIQKKGVEALGRLKTKANNFNAEIHKGVATAAFREAKNAPEVVSYFAKELNINIEVISQDREAQLAYQAVRLYNKERNLLVWDIGGGSFQFTNYDEMKASWNIYKGTLASVSFKDYILNEIKKNPELKTPNPMSMAEVTKARVHIRKTLAASVQKSYLTKQKLRNVVGVGSVLTISVKERVGKPVYTAHDIDQWILKNHAKTDEQLNDPFAATVTSNMILVSEMMKLMKIRQVKALDVSLVEGLATP